jgi:hypothetical protein
MGLVATGLALIGWRLLVDRSAAWLINANAPAVVTVLVAASVWILARLRRLGMSAQRTQGVRRGRRSTFAIWGGWGHRRSSRWRRWSSMHASRGCTIV